MFKPIRRLKLEGADVKVFARPEGACEEAAGDIANLIQFCNQIRGKTILGLATGSTPIPVYEKLVEAHRSRDLSFKKVRSFNLDEYYPMSPTDPNSYRAYMDRHLFSHVDIEPNLAHILDGTVPEVFAGAYADQFDRWIIDEGGIDLQLLGIGRNGHIGFNEPSNLSVEEAIGLRTRLVELHPTTIADAANDFGGEEFVPRRALTMGVASILSARSIVVLAFGANKAPAVARSLLGPITAEVPGSLLRRASGGVTWLIDKAAASEIL